MPRDLMKTTLFGVLLLTLIGGQPLLWGSAVDDFKIKRKQVFEFTQKPTLSQKGDAVTIRFASKAYCDATVVVQRKDGHIVRHLASGVLGPNAPIPLQPNALEQTLIWDGKDELGAYVDNPAELQVRVSLGLSARFEKTLHWHPKKRCGMRKMPRCEAQPEGVYVYEGSGVEYVRLFNHEGQYVRTIHPFPSDTLAKVKGLRWNTFPDGHKAVQPKGYWRSTYMLGGEGDTRSKWGSSARAFTVRNGQIASVSDRLCRLSTGEAPQVASIYGPKTGIPYEPQSIALSPDGQWLYLTGCYMAINKNQVSTHLARIKWQHGVYRMPYAGDQTAKLWQGSIEPGKDAKHFDQPASVCVDAKGRVYIADHRNDRVQIFSPAGDLLKTLPVQGPAILQIHHKTQELYVFSWCMALAFGYGTKPHKTRAALRVFDPFKSFQATQDIPLPLQHYEGTTRGFMSSPHFDEAPYRATLDSYSNPPTVWLGTYWQRRGEPIDSGLSRYRIQAGNSLVLLEKWNQVVKKEVKQWKPPKYQRQRMFVDSRNGTLYVAEDGKKAFDTLTKIDPNTGDTEIITLPYTTEDVAIDGSGHILLRCDRLIGRFDLATLREVPFDYGEERIVKWSSSSRGGSLISALVLPGNRPVWWHESGMGVTPKGEVVVSCCNSSWAKQEQPPKGSKGSTGSKYSPQIYPGRYRYSEIHIWDKHGKMIAEDVVKGVMDGHGTYIDPRGDVYYLLGGHRVYKGKKDFFPLTGCIAKFKQGKGQLYAQRKSEGVPVGFSPDHADTDNLPEVSSGTLGRFRIKDAEWIFPGVGYIHPTAPCQCWKSRFTVDHFGRVFAPETIRNQIAVLDTNGNLMLHIGQYGNIDDGLPLVEDQRYRMQKPRSIGGDEVALTYPNYVVSDSDRRLFIADGANYRILSVQLNYQANEILSLNGTSGGR